MVNPYFGEGGAEAVTFWTLEALRQLRPIKLLTFTTPNLHFANSFYGTNLCSNDFELILRPTSGSTKILKNGYISKQYLIMRYCKQYTENALFFSTSNEMDFGRPGIQYVHLPILADDILWKLNLMRSDKWFNRPSILRKTYHLIYRTLSAYSSESMQSNITFVNSAWTALLVQKAYMMKAHILYPPVLTSPSTTPFFDRENGFVYAGRIVPEKKILNIIKILRLVRNEGFDIHLHLVGPFGDKFYMDQIREMAVNNHDWLKIEGPLNRREYIKTITQHKFGIFGMEHEHFGISIAEMTKTGCIVFIPPGGGQEEIVNFDTRVIYKNEEDAVQKIITVLNNQNNQIAISNEMKCHGTRFSSDSFVNDIRNIVGELM